MYQLLSRQQQLFRSGCSDKHSILPHFLPAVYGDVSFGCHLVLLHIFCFVVSSFILSKLMKTYSDANSAGEADEEKRERSSRRMLGQAKGKSRADLCFPFSAAFFYNNVSHTKMDE